MRDNLIFSTSFPSSSLGSHISKGISAFASVRQTRGHKIRPVATFGSQVRSNDFHQCLTDNGIAGMKAVILVRHCTHERV